MAEEDEIKKYQFGGEEGEFEEFESDDVGGDINGKKGVAREQGVEDESAADTSGEDVEGQEDTEGQQAEGEGEGSENKEGEGQGEDSDQEGEEGQQGDGEGEEGEGEGEEEGEGQGEGEEEEEGEGEEGEGQGQGDEGDEEGQEEGQESEQEMPPPPQDMPEMPSEPPPDDRVNSLSMYYVNNLFFQQTDEDLKLKIMKFMWSVGLHDAYQAIERNALPDTIWIDKEYEALDQIVVKRLMYMIEANRDIFPKGASLDLERYFYKAFKALLIQYSPCVKIRRLQIPFHEGEFRATFDKMSRNEIHFTMETFSEDDGWVIWYSYRFKVKETEQKVDYRSLNIFADERGELGAMRHVIYYLGWALRKKELEREGILETHEIASEIQVGYPQMNEDKLKKALKFVNALA